MTREMPAPAAIAPENLTVPSTLRTYSVVFVSAKLKFCETS